MTEEELDQFMSKRKIYDTFSNIEWKIDAVDNSQNLLLLSDDLGKTWEMSLEYFRKHCFFSDELFGPVKQKTRCECGVDKLGYGIHSNYCPKYEVNK